MDIKTLMKHNPEWDILSKEKYSGFLGTRSLEYHHEAKLHSQRVLTIDCVSNDGVREPAKYMGVWFGTEHNPYLIQIRKALYSTSRGSFTLYSSPDENDFHKEVEFDGTRTEDVGVGYVYDEIRESIDVGNGFRVREWIKVDTGTMLYEIVDAGNSGKSGRA